MSGNCIIQTILWMDYSRNHKLLALQGHIWHSASYCRPLAVYFMGIKCFTHVNIKHNSMESVHCSFCESRCTQIITFFRHTSMLFLRLNVPGRLMCVLWNCKKKFVVQHARCLPVNWEQNLFFKSLWTKMLVCRSVYFYYFRIFLSLQNFGAIFRMSLFCDPVISICMWPGTSLVIM